MVTFLIPPEKILDGINLALHNSDLLLETSVELFNKKNYQQSTPLAILSYEEAAKANWLLRNLEEKRGVSKEDWKSITDHKFKLTQLEKNNLEEINNMSDAEMKIYLKFQQDTVEMISEKSKEHAINKRKDLLEVLDKFQKVKEICFYSNWDLNEKKWKSFQMFPEPDQQAMNYFVNNLAENLFLRVNYKIDLYENPSKSNGIKDVIPDVEKNEIIVLENHEEIKKRKSFQRLKKHFEYSKKNEFLMAKGLIALRKHF